MTTKLCGNCEVMEIEPDQGYCSVQCRMESDATYIYCKECNKLYNMRDGCSSCEAQMYIEELD